jgi:hypothetical protein
LDAQKSKLETLNIKLETEEKLFLQLNNAHEDLKNKLKEIKEYEEEMIYLKPYTEKLPVFNDFKEIISSSYSLISLSLFFKSS